MSKKTGRETFSWIVDEEYAPGVKPVVSGADANREVTLRFRLTQGEFNMIAMVAQIDRDAVRDELEKRGLAPDYHLSPAEWVRQLALQTAFKRYAKDSPEWVAKNAKRLEQARKRREEKMRGGG